MEEKYKLNLTVTFTILIISIWLIWAIRIWDSIGHILLGGAISLFVWALLKNKESVKLPEFLVKSFVVSYAVTNIIWFANLGIVSPAYFALLTSYGLWVLISTLFYIILPRSLLPVAITVIIYGIFRTKLKTWEILLSSWYVSIFAVFAAYSIWWALFVKPYLNSYYSSGAGAIALDMLLVFLAFLVACISSIVYIGLKGPKEKPPP